MQIKSNSHTRTQSKPSVPLNSFILELSRGRACVLGVQWSSLASEGINSQKIITLHCSAGNQLSVACRWSATPEQLARDHSPNGREGKGSAVHILCPWLGSGLV